MTQREPRRRPAPPPPPHEEDWRDSSWRMAIRRKLIAWFRGNARELPWRSEPTPYRVWISEIMLQQTQVATVLPYFERFMKSFPDVNALASAEEQVLLSHWEGLGYYRRARSIHAAAKMIVAEHGGTFPESFDEVLRLPGIGRYTAGAILSIARDQRVPIVEGNTQRVFSRWTAMRGNATAPANVRLLWEIAEAMLPPRGSPGEFNQAAMELGALICIPQNPTCDRCPVRRDCRANVLGLQSEIPGKVTRVRYEDRTEFAFAVEKSTPGGADPGPREFLLRPLPDGGRWAGLWDFARTTERSHDSAEAAAEDLRKSVGVEVVPGLRLKTIRHAVTKYRISLHVHAAQLAGRLPARSPWRFVTLSEMDDLPMSVTGRRIAKMLQDGRQPTLPL